jgi:23S rRNA pseudouridine2605 synthase
MKERLQKLIAASGVASRRKAEEFILNGQVTVNGQVVTELGTKADPVQDHIKVRGKLINPRLEKKEKVYLLLNKPLGYLSSTSDPNRRPLVIDLVGEFRDQVHPVGRLDFNSEGLLLLSNDGEFTNIIAHASSKVAKRYEVKVKGQPNEAQIQRLSRGIVIEQRKTAPAEIRLLEQSATNAWYEVLLFEGRNQQIRKMFDAIGHSVIKLRRVGIGFLDLEKEKLPVGSFRHLKSSEVQRFIRGEIARKKNRKTQAD